MYTEGSAKDLKQQAAALEKEISVEDMQKIVDANEKLIKEMKDAKD